MSGRISPRRNMNRLGSRPRVPRSFLRESDIIIIIIIIIIIMEMMIIIIVIIKIAIMMMIITLE